MFARNFLTSLVLSFFLFPFFVSSVSAQSMFIHPDALSIFLDKPGMSFDFDVFFRSESGGSFQISLQKMRLGEFSDPEYSALDQGFETLALDTDDFELLAGEEKNIKVSGIVPEDFTGSEYYFSVLIDRKSDKPTDRYKLQLTTDVFVHVGQDSSAALEVKDIVPQTNEEGHIEYLQILSDVSGAAFFEVFPELVFFSGDEEDVRVEALPYRVFPGKSSRGFFYYFNGETIDLEAGQFTDIQLILKDQNDGELYSDSLDFGTASQFLSQEREESLYGQQLQLKTRNHFTWTELMGYFVLAVLGLILIGYSFYSKE